MNTSKLQTPRQNWQVAAFPVAVCTLAFLLPVINKGLQIPIILLVIAWALHPKRSIKPLLWPLAVVAGLFVFYLVGVLYSERVSHALNDLVQKLSLILFPLIFVAAKPLEPRMVRLVLRFFVMGTVVALMIAFGTSVVDFMGTGDVRELYMSNFSPVHHPSYLAMFVNFSIAILLIEIEREPKFHRSELRLWGVVLVLALSLIFPASKMGFINFGLLVLFFLILRIANRRFRNVRTALLVGVGVLFFVFLRVDPLASGRVDTFVEVLESDNGGADRPQVESTTARIHIWSILLEELPRHPFGVGGGDTKIALREWYAQHGLHELAEGGLDAHNQFLHTAVAVGIPATLWLVFSLLYPLGKIRRRKYWIYGYFLLSIAVNFAVESMLEKQSGIVFYAFFNSLLLFFGLEVENEPDESDDPL